MKTPFLVIRFVLFALVGYHSVLAIALSAWNIAAAKAAGVAVSSGAIFLIFNACVFLFWMALSAMEYVGQRRNKMASVVAYECFWAGLISVLDLSAAITVAIGGPPVYCQKNAPFDLCASSMILVPVSWFAGVLVGSYFLTIVGLSVGHMHSEPSIWQRSLYDVPWFNSDRVSQYPPRLPPVSRQESTRISFLPRRHSTTSLPERPESPRPTTMQPSTERDDDNPLPLDPQALSERTDKNDPSRPWWSRYRARPGIDLPFAVRFSLAPRSSDIRTAPSRRPQGDTERDAITDMFDDFGQRYANFFPGERRPAQSIPDSVGAFDSDDRPVPRPPRTEWITADGTVAPLRPRHT